MEASRHGRKETVETLIKTHKCSINAQDKVLIYTYVCINKIISSQYVKIVHKMSIYVCSYIICTYIATYNSHRHTYKIVSLARGACVG